MKEIAKKFITEIAIPEVKASPKNINKGLIPRFHTSLSDKFFGGTKTSLAKMCSELAEEGFLHKAFVKFAPNDKDIIEDGIVKEGRNKGMKLGKDGRLSTPIYWLKGDTDIPTWAQSDRTSDYRAGEEWFKNQLANAHNDVPR